MSGPGLTLTAWVKRRGPGGGGVVIHKDFQYSLNITTSIFYAQSVSWNYRGYATGMIPADVWTHVASTYDGTNIRIYLNGNLVGPHLQAPVAMEERRRA